MQCFDNRNCPIVTCHYGRKLNISPSLLNVFPPSSSCITLGQRLSCPQLREVFGHVDSGQPFLALTNALSRICRFPHPPFAHCVRSLRLIIAYATTRSVYHRHVPPGRYMRRLPSDGLIDLS